MFIYLSIDGDDIGNKIASKYLENDEAGLAETVHRLTAIVAQICEHLKLLGFEIIFCAADGIVCKGSVLDQDSLTSFITTIGEPDFTFSVGIGDDLRSSFFALKYAKATGKNRIASLEKGEDLRILNAEDNP